MEGLERLRTGVLPRRDAEGGLEAPGEVALIDEAQGRRDAGRWLSPPQQDLGPLQP